jgi:FKBP-type peptidyl-prolyl cis-trans isomerase 2
LNQWEISETLDPCHRREISPAFNHVLAGEEIRFTSQASRAIEIETTETLADVIRASHALLNGDKFVPEATTPRGTP